MCWLLLTARNPRTHKAWNLLQVEYKWNLFQTNTHTHTQKEAGQTEEARNVGINEAENKTNEQSTF